LQHAIVYRLFAGCCGYRKKLLVAAVLVKETIERQIGQNVAVHDQKIVGQIGDQAQRRHGAERFILHGIVDFDIPSAAVAEIGADDFGLVIDGERDVRKAAGDQLPDDDFEDGLIADRHQRLRQRDGERVQAGAPSAGEDDSAAHGWSLMAARSWLLSSWVSDAWSRPGRCCRRPAACTALASRLQKDQVSMR